MMMPDDAKRPRRTLRMYGMDVAAPLHVHQAVCMHIVKFRGGDPPFTALTLGGVTVRVPEAPVQAQRIG